jgi:hypothetical protein
MDVVAFGVESRISRMNRRKHLALTAALALASLGLLGFDVSKHSIPPDRILSGGPPKDAIPAILEPRFVAAAQAGFLRPGDQVVGVRDGKVAKAYPIRILNWHEVVNDSLNRTPIAVTYCPLTGSAVVYDRRHEGRTLSFGVSGKLYQSNVLLYDHQSESLWSQLGEAAVTGDLTGAKLEPLPAVVTTWQDWRSRHPDTLVLSTETGHRRDYDRDPYASYHQSARVMFPMDHVDPRLRPKEWVLGLKIGERSKAYPFMALAGVRSVLDDVSGKRVRIEFDPESKRATAAEADTGEALPGVGVYWFAWAAFHPHTLVWIPNVPGAGEHKKSRSGTSRDSAKRTASVPTTDRDAPS